MNKVNCVLFAVALYCVTFNEVKAQATPCFPDTNLYCAGTTAISLAPADYNQDGIEDIVAINQNGGYSVMLADGSNGFTTTTVAAVSTQNYVVSGLIDGDGFQDFVVSAGSSINLYSGNGDGTFNLTSGIVPLASDARAIALGDYDNNGSNDLAILESSVGQVEMF